jgi:hypothetical protein
MGLFPVFKEAPSPSVMCDRSDNCLTSWINMNVLNHDPLLSATTQLGQRINLRSEGFCQAGDRKSI